MPEFSVILQRPPDSISGVDLLLGECGLSSMSWPRTEAGLTNALLHSQRQVYLCTFDHQVWTNGAKERGSHLRGNCPFPGSASISCWQVFIDRSAKRGLQRYDHVRIGVADCSAYLIGNCHAAGKSFAYTFVDQDRPLTVEEPCRVLWTHNGRIAQWVCN